MLETSVREKRAGAGGGGGANRTASATLTDPPAKGDGYAQVPGTGVYDQGHRLARKVRRAQRCQVEPQAHTQGNNSQPQLNP